MLLFASDVFALGLTRLRKFQKVELAAGEAKVVQFELTAGDVSFVN
jgi:hypothetical protein